MKQKEDWKRASNINWWTRIFHIQMLFAFGIVLLLAGCTSSSDSAIPFKEVDTIVKVATPSASTFQSLYGRLLESFYPNLKVELIEEGYLDAFSNGTWEEWLEVHQPDIFISSSQAQYLQMAEQGYFRPLDSYVKKDKYDLEAFAEPVIRILRHNPDQNLYGLASHVRSEALFYNTKWFDQQNVPYPADDMNWMDLLRLAETISNQNEQVFGFLNRTASAMDLILMIGASNGLSFWDEDQGRAAFATDSWKQIWQEVITAYQVQAVKDDRGVFPEDVAMFMGDAVAVRQYKNSPSNYSTWQVTSFEGQGIEVVQPISIYAQSKNPDHAWELLKVLIGDDFFRYGSTAVDLMGLPARPALLAIPGIDNEHVFYDAEPGSLYNLEVSYEMMSMVRKQGQRLFEQVLEGEISLDDALQQLDDQLEASATLIR